MKVLYVGSLDPYGTCHSRFRGLQEVERDVEGLDVGPFFPWHTLGRVRTAVETHLLRGPCYRAANEALLERCRQSSPDVVWVDKGDWVRPETLEALRADGVFLVSHNTDALYYRRGVSIRVKRRLLLATAPCYDVFFTTNDVDYERLQSEPWRTLFTDLGYDHRRFEPSPLPPEQARRWDQGLVFAGHHEPHTESGALALLEAGLDVHVYGHKGWFRSRNRDRFGDRLQLPLGNEDYVSALKGARIGLCWVSKANYNQTSARTFEVAGSGTFLLAMRTRQHLECFEEGVEAEFFDGDEELVEKARYYLEHDAEREAIARRGLQRCVDAGYSWDAIMARDWQRVLEVYEGGARRESQPDGAAAYGSAQREVQRGA